MKANVVVDISFVELLTLEKILADDRFHLDGGYIGRGAFPDGHHVVKDQFSCDGIGYFRYRCFCGWLGPANRDAEHDTL